MLIYKGYNVYPRRLEKILLTCPDVVNATVVGRPVLDVDEIPIAFVVRKTGATVTCDQLMAFVNEKAYQRLRSVEWRDALPGSAAGKVLKRNCGTNGGNPMTNPMARGQRSPFVKTPCPKGHG